MNGDKTLKLNKSKSICRVKQTDQSMGVYEHVLIVYFVQCIRGISVRRIHNFNSF